MATKKAATKTTQGSTAEAVNVRRAGPKKVAAAIMGRGERFWGEVVAAGEDMRRRAAQTTQVEPRATQH